MLVLQELLKYSKGCDGCDDLQEALTSILGILKAVNDSMHLIAITGYEVRTPSRVVRTYDLHISAVLLKALWWYFLDVDGC